MLDSVTVSFTVSFFPWKNDPSGFFFGIPPKGSAEVADDDVAVTDVEGVEFGIAFIDLVPEAPLAVAPDVEDETGELVGVGEGVCVAFEVIARAFASKVPNPPVLADGVEVDVEVVGVGVDVTAGIE